MVDFSRISPLEPNRISLDEIVPDERFGDAPKLDDEIKQTMIEQGVPFDILHVSGPLESKDVAGRKFWSIVLTIDQSVFRDSIGVNERRDEKIVKVKEQTDLGRVVGPCVFVSIPMGPGKSPYVDFVTYRGLLEHGGTRVLPAAVVTEPETAELPF